MKRFVIAASLAVIVGTAHYSLEMNAVNAVSTVTLPATELPATVSPAPEAPVTIDESVIWLDPVVVIAPRYVEDADAEPAVVAGSNRPAAEVIAAASGE